jgi:hypothetical protein
MVNKRVLTKVAQRLPGPVRSLARAAYYRGAHWAHPAMRGFGTVQDLYYWVSDGNIDTLLLLQNYFSALYPHLDTKTKGMVYIHDENGNQLGSEAFELAHSGCARLRVSTLLKRFANAASPEFGTLEVNIEIPKDVLSEIKNQPPFYFWDRFYIGYTTARGQTCFVHGVDKTHIYREGKDQPQADWYKQTKRLDWAPEIPVNINDYQKLSVVLINRTNLASEVELTILDCNDKTRSWEQTIPAKGVRRFELTPDSAVGLDPMELRLQVSGMTSQYGRPVLFKEFRNGAISAMHC